MRLSTAVLSLSLSGVVAYAVYLHFENARLKQEAQGRSPVAELDGRLNRGADNAAASASEAPGMVESLKIVPLSQQVPAPAAAERENSDGQDRRRDRMQRMAAAFDDPQMRVDMVERQMNRIDSRFADFFKELNREEDDLNTLRALMAERNLINWETRMRGVSAEGEEERARLQAEGEQRRKLLEQEIDSLLGEDDAVALRDYTESLPYREEVSRLETSLSFTDTPLSGAQSELLVEQIRSATQDFEYTTDLSGMRGRELSSVGVEEVSQYFDERARHDELILQSVASTLNEQQLSALAERQMAERERDQRQMQFMLESGAPGGWRGRPGD